MAKTAFGMYAGMGPTRSLKGLVTELHRNYIGKAPQLRQIAAWSSTFRWQDRVRAHDDAVAVEVEAQLLERRSREAVEQRDLRLEVYKSLLRKVYDYFAGPTKLMDMDHRMVIAAVRALTVLSEGQRIDYGQALAPAAAVQQPSVQVQKAIILTGEEAREWIDSLSSSAADRDPGQPVIEGVPYDFPDPGFWRHSDDPMLPALSEGDGDEVLDYRATRAG